MSDSSAKSVMIIARGAGWGGSFDGLDIEAISAIHAIHAEDRVHTTSLLATGASEQLASNLCEIDTVVVLPRVWKVHPQFLPFVDMVES